MPVSASAVLSFLLICSRARRVTSRISSVARSRDQTTRTHRPRVRECPLGELMVRFVTRRPLPPRADDEKRSPDNGASGARSQAFTSMLRAGKACPNVAWCSATRRRAELVSGSTRRRLTRIGRQPILTAMSRARRTLRSSVASMPPTSGTTDFTSITRRVFDAAWNARMSMEPRSPYSLKVTSVATDHPSASRRATMASTSAAWC